MTSHSHEDRHQLHVKPWYQRTFRWAQTNITEIDPLRYDLDWWRDYWRRTHVQGIIVNAGGIFAYYPSDLPYTHPAKYLDKRDLLGELVDVAREDGLVVIARMDSNRVHENVFNAHPDWIAVDQEGQPYRAGELYITCIDSPYYDKYLPEVLREITRKYHPDGFTDNSYSGLDRNRISYSSHATERFRRFSGMHLPGRKDWSDPVYLSWLECSYQRRIEIWDMNNQVVKESGGEDCLWMGMVGGDFAQQGVNFRDLKEIASRSKMVMVDFQSRQRHGGFSQNSEVGKLIHGLVGWETPVIESMAQYAHGQPFRISAAQGQEARLWMVAGFAGGIMPWYHHIGAYHDDRRQYMLAEELLSWHAANEQYLVNRTPVASVGVVWSQTNADYYGRDESYQKVTMPWQGITRALVRARVLYLPVHVDDIGHQSVDLDVLILPNLAAMSDDQCQDIRDFVRKGGSVIATFESSLFDSKGIHRPNFGLGDLLGVKYTGGIGTMNFGNQSRWDLWEHHSYLRLHPEFHVSSQADGEVNEEFEDQLEKYSCYRVRHPVLEGFEETDSLPFGGTWIDVKADPDAIVPLTYGNPFPVYPPETAYTLSPDSGIPVLVLRDSGWGGRIAYIAADLDRCYAMDNLPDHARLLESLFRWTAGGKFPLEVKGTGLIDCNLYRQDNRLVLHLVNLSGSGEYPLHEMLPVGPITVHLTGEAISYISEKNLMKINVQPLVEEQEILVKTGEDWLEFLIPTILSHEVLVIGTGATSEN